MLLLSSARASLLPLFLTPSSLLHLNHPRRLLAVIWFPPPVARRPHASLSIFHHAISTLPLDAPPLVSSGLSPSTLPHSQLASSPQSSPPPSGCHLVPSARRPSPPCISLHLPPRHLHSSSRCSSSRQLGPLSFHSSSLPARFFTSIIPAAFWLSSGSLRPSPVAPMHLSPSSTTPSPLFLSMLLLSSARASLLPLFLTPSS